MPDRVFYPLAFFSVAGMIALATVWPQGIGARSPAPFGHPVTVKPAAVPSKEKIKTPGIL